MMVRAIGDPNPVKRFLAIRKVSGTRLGNPVNIDAAGEIGRISLKCAADERARALLLVLPCGQKRGRNHSRTTTICSALNRFFGMIKLLSKTVSLKTLGPAAR